MCRVCAWERAGVCAWNDAGVAQQQEMDGTGSTGELCEAGLRVLQVGPPNRARADPTSELRAAWESTLTASLIFCSTSSKLKNVVLDAAASSHASALVTPWKLLQATECEHLCLVAMHGRSALPATNLGLCCGAASRGTTSSCLEHRLR